jgi:hypothetical protein
MQMSEKKAIAKEYFHKIAIKKDSIEYKKKHEESKVRKMTEIVKRYEAKEIALVKHEKENLLVKEVRFSEFKKREHFLKLSTQLNII